MNDSIDNIPDASRTCPICDSGCEIIRIIPFGFNKSEKQYKLRCTSCGHTWLYHSDE